MSEPRILRSTRKVPKIPTKTFPAFILDNAHQHGNKPYMVEHESGKHFTYDDFRSDTLRLARALKDLGYRPDDKFLLYGYNCYELYVTFIAGMAVGGVAISVRGQDTHCEVEDAIRKRNVKWLFVQQQLVPNFAEIEALEHIKLFTFDADEKNSKLRSIRGLISGSCLLQSHEVFNPPDLRTTPAVILESSGTTGPAKGAIFSHFTLTANFCSFTAALETLDHDTNLTGSPLAHFSGIALAFSPFCVGAKVVVLKENNDQLLPDLIEYYKVTKIWSPPSPLVNLIKANDSITLSTLRSISVGGARIRPAEPEMFIKRYKPQRFVNAYGLTEAGSFVCEIDLIDANPGTVAFDCVGKVLPNVEVKVIDPNKRKMLGPNESGEICVKSLGMFLGYHNDPERTKATVDEENWIHTGDTGYYDESEYLYIVGRSKDLIDQKGYHFPPADLEDILIKHDAVKDVCVVGIPDLSGGELAHAFVITKENVHTTASELKAYVNERISRIKRLEGDVHFVSEFPKTAIGKIKRSALRDGYQELLTTV